MSSAATVLFVILIFTLLLTCAFALALVKQHQEIAALRGRVGKVERKISIVLKVWKP